MEITISQTALKGLLARVVKVIKKSPLPVLECVKLEAMDSSLRATASDLSTWLLADAKCKTENQGIITVSGKKLYEIVKLLPEDNVIFKTNENSVTIQCQSSVFRMPMIDPDDYPKEHNLESNGFIEIPRTTLQDALNAVSFATAKDEWNSVLSGILFEFSEGKLRLVACDGHRLGKISIPVQYDKEQKMVIPSDIGKHVRNMDGSTIKLFVDKSTIAIYADNLGITSKIIEGDYPNYANIIPKDNDKVSIVDREKLIQGLKQTETIAETMNQIAQTTIEKDAEELVLSSAGQDFESKVKVECQYRGEPIKIGFNAKFLLDILLPIKNEQVEWKFKDPNSAMTLEPKTDEPDLFYLLMPIHLT